MIKSWFSLPLKAFSDAKQSFLGEIVHNLFTFRVKKEFIFKKALCKITTNTQRARKLFRYIYCVKVSSKTQKATKSGAVSKGSAPFLILIVIHRANGAARRRARYDQLSRNTLAKLCHVGDHTHGAFTVRKANKQLHGAG